MDSVPVPEVSLNSFDLEALLREPLPLYTSFPDVYSAPFSVPLYPDEAHAAPYGHVVPSAPGVVAPDLRAGQGLGAADVHVPRGADAWSAPVQGDQPAPHPDRDQFGHGGGAHFDQQLNVPQHSVVPPGARPQATVPHGAAPQGGLHPNILQDPAPHQGSWGANVVPSFDAPSDLPDLQTAHGSGFGSVFASEPGSSSAPSSNGETPRTVVNSRRGGGGRGGSTRGAKDSSEHQAAATISSNMAAGTAGAGGSSGIASKDEETQERIRAKNRRAQTRYRAKLKAQAQNTAQAHSKVADEVARLKIENEQLHAANDVMERVLVVRDGYMDILKGAQDPYVTRLSAIGTVTDAARHVVEDDDLTCEEAMMRCPLTGLTRVEIQAIKNSKPNAAVVGWRELVPRLEDALSQLDAPSAHHSAQEMARAEILLALRDARTLCFEHAVFRPSNVQRLMALNLDAVLLRPEESSADDATAPEAPAGSTSRANGAHWRKVAKALGITHAQRAVMLPVGEVFLRRITRVMTARRDILTRVTEAATSARAGPAASGSGSASDEAGGAATDGPGSGEAGLGSRSGSGASQQRDAAVVTGRAPSSDAVAVAAMEAKAHELIMLQRATCEWLRTNELSGELRANLQLEHVACMEFVARTFGDVLDSVQKARAIVNAYPFFPDMYSILIAVARDPSLLDASTGGPGLLGCNNVAAQQAASAGAREHIHATGAAALGGDGLEGANEFFAGRGMGVGSKNRLVPTASPRTGSGSGESLEFSGDDHQHGSEGPTSLDATSAVHADSGDAGGDSSSVDRSGSKDTSVPGDGDAFVKLHPGTEFPPGPAPTACTGY